MLNLRKSLFQVKRSNISAERKAAKQNISADISHLAYLLLSVVMVAINSGEHKKGEKRGESGIERVGLVGDFGENIFIFGT